jgi:hypothetical protein
VEGAPKPGNSGPLFSPILLKRSFRLFEKSIQWSDSRGEVKPGKTAVSSTIV